MESLALLKLYKLIGEEIKPTTIYHIVENDLDEFRSYTFVILGRAGVTGKTWLCNSLLSLGVNAVEISESVNGLVDYIDGKNHIDVSIVKRTATIVLNEYLREK